MRPFYTLLPIGITSLMLNPSFFEQQVHRVSLYMCQEISNLVIDSKQQQGEVWVCLYMSTPLHWLLTDHKYIDPNCWTEVAGTT